MQNWVSTLKKTFIWDCDNPIENKNKNKPWILFLNKSNIKEEWHKVKTTRKIKDKKLKKKNISSLVGKLIKPVNQVTKINKSNLQTT